MTSNYSILLALCRVISGIPHSDGTIPVSETDDQHRLFDLFQYHQIIALVYHYRKQLAERGIRFGEELISELKGYTLLNISRVMIYEHFLKHLDALFRKNSIDYRLIKGIVTAQSAYPQDYLRSFGDVDLLIKPDDLEHVQLILEQDGFYHADDLYSVFPSDIIQKYSFAQHFIRSESGNISVDLHLNLSGRLHPFQFDSGDFWTNTTLFSYNGLQINTFSPEHQAVYAIYHAFKHYYFKLIWFIDSFLLMDRSELDKTKFLQLIKQYKMSRLLNFFASIALDLFGRLPYVIADQTDFGKKKHQHINSQTVIAGFFPYSQSRARLIMPMYYMQGVGPRLIFLWRQLFPPMETIRDFYVGKYSGKGFLSYLKLRCRAICDLCINKTKEEYTN